MPVENPRILTRNYGAAESWSIDTYERNGGYQSLRKALAMGPEKIRDEVKAANLRGRGGAGFPAGVKWSFLKAHPEKPSYIAVNADEGEPGTFKDRTLMELDPHRCIEGFIIAAYALDVHHVYCYVRGELVLSIRRLEQAVREARAKGYLGDKHARQGLQARHRHPRRRGRVHLRRRDERCSTRSRACAASPGSSRHSPRWWAPSGAPTIVNNLETLATVPTIIEMGGDSFSKLSRLHHLRTAACGCTASRGTSSARRVRSPGGHHAPRAHLRPRRRRAQGDRKIKAVIPGGSSTPVLRPEDLVVAADEKHILHPWHGKSHLDVPMGVDTMRALGTMLGTCCAIVMDDTTSMVRAAENLMLFYAHESCGQCTPCREGCAWMARLCRKFANGTATMTDLDTLGDVANNIMGNTICALGDGAAMPMLGILKLFRHEFEEVVRTGRAPQEIAA
jgi:NADH-quinone oxidoreductase subunit F